TTSSRRSGSTSTGSPRAESCGAGARPGPGTRSRPSRSPRFVLGWAISARAGCSTSSPRASSTVAAIPSPPRTPCWSPSPDGSGALGDPDLVVAVDALDRVEARRRVVGLSRVEELRAAGRLLEDVAVLHEEELHPDHVTARAVVAQRDAGEVLGVGDAQPGARRGAVVGGLRALGDLLGAGGLGPALRGGLALDLLVHLVAEPAEETAHAEAADDDNDPDDPEDPPEGAVILLRRRAVGVAARPVGVRLVRRGSALTGSARAGGPALTGRRRSWVGHGGDSPWNESGAGGVVPAHAVYVPVARTRHLLWSRHD